jgi:hypothetical protein
MTQVPGLKAKHAIITDQCRLNRTDEGAVDEALRRVRQEALECMAGWPTGAGAQFHIALTIERPDTPSCPPHLNERTRMANGETV